MCVHPSLFTMHRLSNLWVHKSIHQELAIVRIFPNLAFSCHDSGNVTDSTVPIISDTSVVPKFKPQKSDGIYNCGRTSLWEQILP